MAVAAYASVLSLLRVVDNIQLPSHLRLFPDTNQIDALREKLSFLQHFLEQHSSSTITKEIECTIRKIPRVTYDAKILIDNFVVDQLYKELYPQNDVECGNIHDEIHRVIQDIESINEAFKTLKSIQRDEEQPATFQLDKFTGDKPLKNKMVGFDDQLNQVLEKLTSNPRDLVIVPIIGMGGIGKTTLARSLFDHPYNLHYFQVRIWFTISQDYSVKKVLEGLLQDGVLGDKGFPDNGQGSRVVVTTRLCDIANSLDSRNNRHSMEFLDEDKSWDLFSDKAFEKGGRSRELEEIGREISERCNGLPLLLVLIGGLLANSNMTVEHWQIVANDINSFANSANDEYCLRILSLSYNHLPIQLKPCFLYTRHFEEDSNIRVSSLIEEWVSEGFVKPIKGKSLEEAAREYLEDLIGRNMLMIRKRDRVGNIRICGVHDLLRDLSIKESEKELLLEVPKAIFTRPFDIEEACVICNERKTDTMAGYIKALGSKFDSKFLMCSSCERTFPDVARSRFIMAFKFEFQTQNVPLLTTCRSITLYTIESVFSTIRLIWNLEYLDITTYRLDLPKEIWEMPQLRHVKVNRATLPDPVSTNTDVIVLENLQTFTEINGVEFTEEIARRIPNLRKLGLWYDQGYFSAYKEEDRSYFHLQNLARLQKLEWLYVSFHSAMDFKKVIAFPCSLKKLILLNCEIGWEDLTIIGSLPNLEVLKLYYKSVLGDEWIPIEGEFQRLKCLKLSSLNLVHWRVDGTTHFPALETLFLGYMKHLEEIPQELGELPSLNSIYVKHCRENIINSAGAVVEEQLSNGNERLVLHVLNEHGEWVDYHGHVNHA